MNDRNTSDLNLIEEKYHKSGINGVTCFSNNLPVNKINIASGHYIKTPLGRNIIKACTCVYLYI